MVEDLPAERAGMRLKGFQPFQPYKHKGTK